MAGEAALPGTGALILLVDDEPQIHRFLRPTLEAAGYRVARADTAAEALAEAARRPPDLILLDLGLPDMDGQEVLQRLRAFCAAPVIILSARDRASEKIQSLDAGASDYVEKPFDMGELMARIRAALRLASGRARADAETPRGFSLPPLQVDLERRSVRVENEIIALTPREYDLLALLARNSGRVLTHRQLLTSVWGPAHAHDVQYLRVYMGHLRQKLGCAAALLLKTEAGIGYRLGEAPSWSNSTSISSKAAPAANPADPEAIIVSS